MKLDENDRKLISLLRENARTPVTSLAEHLGLSRATVQNRIDRLLDTGVIQGFSVRVKPEADSDRIRAITLIQTRARKTNDVLQSLSAIPEVSALHTTNGRWDIVTEINIGSLEQFDIALTEIREIEGVANTETSILLTSHKF